jgi:prepilin-type N-terminal cleavage/methylation domain-containing protein
MRRRRESGLTLIEVMVVIAIIGIVSAVAVPAVLNWLPDYRVKRAAREMYGNLQRGKMAAVRECAPCTIAFLQGPDAYTVSSGNKRIDLAAYGSGIKFEGPAGEVAFPVAGFVFDARGLCTTPTPGWAYLTNDRQTLFYRVGPSTPGGIRMQRYDRHSGTWSGS